MSGRRLALAAPLLFGAAFAWAQVPPTPDATRYPQLAATKTWLEQGSAQAKHCALSGGLFIEANQLYRANLSEPKTVEAMMRAHTQKFSTAERERLRGIIVHVTGMAAGFVELHADSASVAFAQLCMGRAQKGGELTTATLSQQFVAARQCERDYSAGSLDRKECIAVAFRVK